MQQVGDELVVAFEIQIAHVKEHNAILRFATFAQNFDGFAVTLQQRLKILRYDGKLDHFRQGTIRQFRDQLRGHSVVGSRFDHQGELRGGLRQFGSRLRGGKLRAVDDVSPVDQVGQRLGIEPELFLGNRGD